ncbi:hypothetical protein ACHAXS_013682 [Conticribra weissflogii]
MPNIATSLTKAPRQTNPSFTTITAPAMQVVMNIAAPVKAPKLIRYPFSGSDTIALIVAETSAAPFPSANRVTPANRGGSPNLSENISKLGEKYSSAVVPNSRNKMVSPKSKKGERIMSQEVVEKTELLQKTKGKRTPSDSQVWA